ncbi:hypothetical protein BJF92_12645 [Rhizobium rhizosphaerae]|uniref:Uncharacterized protein n=2 Tax=Xaviernesmea rhizosphaerae TaxID=1672749 RepID=A0A1Q9AJR3_9HYPH|nr:hypothetical protein BJF92_12645 [Xaviernesmea rhizosphaerae]
MLSWQAGRSVARRGAAVSLALVLPMLLAAAPAAAQMRDVGTASADYPFANLPGVKPQEPLVGGPDQLHCRQALVPQRDTVFSSANPRYDTVNVCRKGDGPEFSSPRLPPSIYRQLRGLDY